MSEYITGKVTAAGAATGTTETPPPVIYIEFSDNAAPPSFIQKWFFASNDSKNEMLAVALAAISAGLPVQAFLDPPNPGNSPVTEIYRFYLQAQ